MQRQVSHGKRHNKRKRTQPREHLPNHSDTLSEGTLHLCAQRSIERGDERDRRVRDRNAVGELLKETCGEAVCELGLEDRRSDCDGPDLQIHDI